MHDESKPDHLPSSLMQPKHPHKLVQEILHASSDPQSNFSQELNAATDVDEAPPKRELQCPFFIEICAGSARVTSCLQHLGLSASFGVDHKIHRNAGRVLVADLTV